MKKNTVTVKNFTELQSKIANAKKQIKNELTEDAAELRRSLLELLDELDNAEIEVDEESLASRVRELIDAYNRDENSDVPAAVANAIAAKFAAMQKQMPVSDKLTPAIKNQVAAAVLRSKGREAVEDAVNAVMVKNGITGLTFNDVIDFAVNDNWGDSDELFAALKKVRFSKFFYTADDFNDSDLVAHGWDKTSENEKVIQQLTVQGKRIDTQYIYKRQQIAFEDLDDIEESGTTATFLRWLDEELDRQIINAFISVLLGDVSIGQAIFSDIISVESLPGSGTDVFRTSVTVADLTDISMIEARKISDAVISGRGPKWMVMNQTQLTELARFRYASGGDESFRSKEELAAMLGVDRIYVTDKAITMICFIPSEYWVKEKASLQVAYPRYENNVMNYQRERNIGGAVHGLKSVAFAVEG